MHSLLLNSQYELGLKALLILMHEQPLEMSCERIMYYDYYSSYNPDIINGNEVDSLSPLYPYRYAELISKRNKLIDGILYFCAKGLIAVCHDHRGITYRANTNTMWFCGIYDKSAYAKKYMQALSNCSSVLAEMKESEIVAHYRRSVLQRLQEETLQYFDGGNTDVF